MRGIAALWVLVAACSDEGGPIPLEDLQGASLNARCSAFVTCGLVEDIALCRKRLRGSGTLDPSLLAAIDAGKVIYHADKARECIDGIGNGCNLGAIASANVTACDDTFEGTVGAGGECAIDEVCKSNVCDVPTCPDACCKGTCVGDAPIPRPTVGQSCAMNSQCVESFCDGETTTCLAYRAEGEPCMSSSQCGTHACANQICKRRPGPGESCDPFVDLCNHMGYTCSSSSMTCVPVGLTGDPCNTFNDCSTFFYNCTAGTCRLGPQLGEMCTSDGAVCVDGSFCDYQTGKCAARLADGVRCEEEDQCRSDYCADDGTCASEPVCF